MKLLPANLATAVALLGSSILPTVASEADNDNKIHGRWDFALEADLRERGVDVSGIEEWGDLIRAWVRNADGTTSMVLFNADTLQQVPVARN